MFTFSKLQGIVSEQNERLLRDSKKNELKRLDFFQLPSPVPEFARIITGIRRCGKSTLMKQYMASLNEPSFFLTFEDPRLYGFEEADFALLDKLIESQKSPVSLYFDEIQNIPGWEIWIRQKLDQHFNVMITGSNASLLSHELGTRLTGRHLDTEVFPFSWQEYKSFLPQKSFSDYVENGGFPEFLNYQNEDILRTLFDDILTKDIAVRYGIRDVRSLKVLAICLASNCGNLVTASKIATQLGIKTNVTALEYFSYLERCYLFYFVPKFSYSLRAQSVNPKKVYCVDQALLRSVSISASKDLGRIFENMVYLHLRRKGYSIFYYAEKDGECDFVYGHDLQIEYAVQVCLDLNEENFAREVSGLIKALEAFPGIDGCIVTKEKSDLISYSGRMIKVLSAEEFFS